MPFVKRVNAKNLPIIVDTRKIFIGRTDELHFFIEHILQPEDTSYNIVSISGEGGVGKSTLLARFIEETKLPPFKDYCLAVLVDEQQTTPFTVMEKFAAQLSEVSTPLLEFEKALSHYKETIRKLQIERETTQNTVVRETVDLVGTVAEEVPIVGGIIHKGANIVTELYLQDRHTRQMLKDAELLEDPLSDLTKVFVEELNHLTDKQFTLSPNKTKRNQRIILFFDTFEQLASEIAPWLLNHLLQTNISTNIVIVVAGRDSIEHSIPNDPKRWLPYRDNGIIYLINLNNFTEEETSAYLAERGISDPAYITTIWQLSKGLPLYLGLLTFNLEGNVDPTADVVANFLRWIPEHENIKRKLALDAALFSRPFSQDDLTAFSYVKQEERDTLYRWLTRLPFVRTNPQDGRYRYHDLAQDMFRRDLYQRSRKEYYTTRRALAAYYRQMLEQTRKNNGNDNFVSVDSLELTLALVYQLFYLPDESSHLESIEKIIIIFKDTNTEQDIEIIRFFRELSHERDSSKIGIFETHIAKIILQFIEADSEDQSQKQIEAGSELIKNVAGTPTFSSALLAWIYDKRGDAYDDLKEYQRAIQDYERAIELDSSSAVYYTDRGIIYRKIKEYQQAIQDFDRAITLNLNYARAYNNRGLVYNDLREYQRAIQDFDRAIELTPTSSTYCSNRANAYYNLKEYERAIQEYDQAIELNPTSAVYYTWRGNAYYNLEEYERATQDYDRAIELNPANAVYYNNRGNVLDDLKEYERAIQDYDRAIELNPTNATYYNNRGYTFRNLKEYERAIQNYERAIELNPAEATYYKNRGDICHDLKEYERAIQDYERAIELNPTNAVYYNFRGSAYYDLKKYERAIQDFDQAIELDTTNASYYYNRGYTFRNLKEYERAIQDFDQAIELNPAEAKYYKNRGDICRDLKEYERAVQDYDRVIELNPTNAMYYNNRGNIFYDLKKYERATQDYDRAIKLNPAEAVYYNNRGNAYYNLEEYERAIQDFDQAIELNPASAAYYNVRGNAYYDLKKYERAIQDYDRAIELNPINATYYNNRGYTYKNLKEYERAIQDYDQAVDLDPNDAKAYGNRGLTYLWLQNIKQARIDYSRGYELKPTSVYCGWMLEWIRINQEGIDKDTPERLETIARLEPQDYEAFVCRGVALLLSARFEEAHGELTKAITLKPEYWDAYFWEGFINASFEKAPEALEALEKALSVGLPPVLLTPLTWLEQKIPDFYNRHLKSFFEQ